MKMRSWTRAEPLDQGRDQGGTRRSSSYVAFRINVILRGPVPKIPFSLAISERPWKLTEGVSVNKTTFFWGLVTLRRAKNQRMKKNEKFMVCSL